MSYALANQRKDSKVGNKTTTPTKRSSNEGGANVLTMTPQDSIIHLQQTIGNQAVQRLMRSNSRNGTVRTRIQPKLKVSQPRDAYEQEADRVAEQVMRMSDPTHIGTTVSIEKGRINCKCSSCKTKKGKEEEEKLKISRKASTMFNSETSEEATTKINNVLSTSGSSLDNDSKDLMESRFGYNLSGVRIHKDTRATESAQSVNALAYSVKQDIVFGPGQYTPRTKEGQQLLAHELVHTIQSRDGTAEGKIQRRRVPSGPGLETALPTSGAGMAMSRPGMARLLSRAWAELTPAKQEKVRTNASKFGISWVGGESDLLAVLEAHTTRGQFLLFAKEIVKADPSANLGEAVNIDMGPRLGTKDEENITTLVNKANEVFAKIAAGAWDVHVGQVFSTANIATAKAKYANAHAALNLLKAAKKILSDRSGYFEEAHVAGRYRLDSNNIRTSCYRPPDPQRVD